MYEARNYDEPTCGDHVTSAERLVLNSLPLHDAQPKSAMTMHDDMRKPEGKFTNEGPLIVNLDKALERLDQDRSLFNEMAGFFLSDSQSLVDIIRGSLDNRTQDELVRAVHTLRNLAATCGGERTALAASRLEQLGLTADWEAIPSSLMALEGEMATLGERLRGLVWEG